MTKPLTLRNREDKEDVDLSLREYFPRTLQIGFPSYFTNFCLFSQFLALLMQATFTKRRHYQKHEIPPAAAIMAIV